MPNREITIKEFNDIVIANKSNLDFNKVKNVEVPELVEEEELY